MNRTTVGRIVVARANAGRTRCARRSPGEPLPTAATPADGSTRRVTANTRMSTIPSQNTGIARPTALTTLRT